MGIVSCEGQTELSIRAAKIFRMVVLETETYLSKVVPGAIANFVNLQGDGGPGTLRQITFVQGGPVSYVKETVDVVDKENFIFDYTIIGGDPALIDTNLIEKMSFHVTFEISPTGGTICKRSGKAYIIDGVEVKEDEIRADLEHTTQVFFGTLKLYEAYALANPDA
ncbi:hypothetical protein JCGZ_09809 [Jatropha curcas]|uniref:Bet v I/Major latex protein domain-containing protein n=1 Tax=Jatropha curcas TaxID=180498 RepID=A0A067KWQ7_JATCU|nr:hypothetical protein JCGZ_09809 [Jatropha curcas]